MVTSTVLVLVQSLIKIFGLQVLFVGSSKKASQCKAGACTLGACAHVITGLALCFHLLHHVKDPQTWPSNIASTYILRSFWIIRPSYLSLPAREELINNVYEL